MVLPDGPLESWEVSLGCINWRGPLVPDTQGPG